MRNNIPVLLSFSDVDDIKLYPTNFLLNFHILIFYPTLKNMKKLLLCLAGIAFIALTLTSCAASKRDCQGTKHYKQKGGFYL
jgi:hypothetical protein